MPLKNAATESRAYFTVSTSCSQKQSQQFVTGYKRRIVTNGGVSNNPKGWNPLAYRVGESSGPGRSYSASQWFYELLPTTPVTHLRHNYESWQNQSGPTHANMESDTVEAFYLNNAESIAYAKLMASMKETRNAEWMASVALGEARETARMIAGTARRLAQGMLALRRGNIPGAYHQLVGRPMLPRELRRFERKHKKHGFIDDLASAWMEFNYGWKPLISDIDSAAKYLAEKRVARTDPVYRISRKHTWGQEVVQYDPALNVSLQHGAVRERMFIQQYATVRLIYLLRPLWQKNPSTLEELGFYDVYSTAWNLMPLSFVSDWFWNISQVLESLYEFNQWQVVRGLRAAKQVRLRKNTEHSRAASTFNPYFCTGYADLQHKFPPQEGIMSVYTRSLLGSLPTAIDLRTKVSNPFDLKTGQMASAAALLRYAFR